MPSSNVVSTGSAETLGPVLEGYGVDAEDWSSTNDPEQIHSRSLGIIMD